MACEVKDAANRVGRCVGWAKARLSAVPTILPVDASLAGSLNSPRLHHNVSMSTRNAGQAGFSDTTCQTAEVTMVRILAAGFRPRDASCMSLLVERAQGRPDVD